MLTLVACSAVFAGVVAYLLLLHDNGFGGFAYAAPSPRAPERREEGTLETVTFPAVDGLRLEGWLIRPSRVPAPLVVMAPGLTGTKDGHLEPLAWRFARAGFAVLLFDFRCLGGSEGLPRHWVDPFRQADDYRAALSFAGDALVRDGVALPARVALWGSSFSAGSALVAAAGRDDVAAVVAQCPFLATPPHLEPRGLALARFAFWTTLDLARARLGLAPVYVPAFGQPGELCFAPSRENPSRFDPAQRGARFWQTLPPAPRGGWQNKLLARFLADFDRFQPLAALPSLRCPVLFVAARRDDLAPLALVERGHVLAPPRSTLAIQDCGHFELYLEPALAQNAARQIEFLEGVLSPVERPPRACNGRAATPAACDPSIA
jgi:pimeloyl-ACP methyl ester carboxylesterase